MPNQTAIEAARGWVLDQGSLEGNIKVDLLAEALTALITRREQEAVAAATGMKMYVWTRQPMFIAVARARSVAEARDRMIAEIGASGDGSCPERDKARAWVKEQMPSIWQGTNAEFALTDSAELVDLVAFLESVQKELCELKAATPEIIRAAKIEALEWAQDVAVHDGAVRTECDRLKAGKP